MPGARTAPTPTLTHPRTHAHLSARPGRRPSGCRGAGRARTPTRTTVSSYHGFTPRFALFCGCFAPFCGLFRAISLVSRFTRFAAVSRVFRV
eukprot:7001892-Prymnesium_polylepis.1